MCELSSIFVQYTVLVIIAVGIPPLHIFVIWTWLYKIVNGGARLGIHVPRNYETARAFLRPLRRGTHAQYAYAVLIKGFPLGIPPLVV